MSANANSEKTPKQYILQSHQLLDQMNEGYALHEMLFDKHGAGTDYIFLEVNRKFEEITGLKNQEITGRRVKEVLPDVEPGLIARYGEVVRSGIPLELISYVEPLKKYFHISAFRVDQTRFAVLFSDATSHIRNDKRMREQKKILESVLKASHSGYWQWDLEKEDHHLSSTLLQMLGYDPDQPDPYLRSWKDLIYQEDLPLAEENLNAHIESLGVRPFYTEVRCRNRKQELVWTLCTGQVLEWGMDGKPRRIIGALTDIHQRKAAEEKTLRMMREYETVFNATNDAIFLVKVANQGESFLFVRNNRFHQRVTGISGPLFANKTPQALFGPTVGENVAANFRRCLEARDTIQYEEEVFLPAGKRTWFTELHPIRENGGIDFIVGASRDITDEKKRETEIFSAMAAAKEANRLKSMFLANLSHEIRTPMNGIVGLSHLIKKELGQEASLQVAAYLEDIQKASKDLLRVINDILDYSEIELGKVQLASAPLSLHRILASLERQYEQEIMQKSLFFQVDYDSAYQEVFLGDEDKLRQILENLLSNAIKFTHSGGIRIAVRLSWEDASNGEVRITVKDTGIGIPPDKRDLVFQGFTQGDGSIARSYQGTGLGLAIVRGLVQLMGGKVWLEELPEGEGTGVTLSLILEKQLDMSASWSGETRLQWTLLNENKGGGKTFRHIEYERTLARLGGDRSSYHGILRHYERSSRELFENLVEKAESGDWEGLARAAHSLKGASANVGIPGIALWSNKIEEAARAGARYELLLDHLGQDLQEVWTEIRWLQDGNREPEDGRGGERWSADGIGAEAGPESTSGPDSKDGSGQTPEKGQANQNFAKSGRRNPFPKAQVLARMEEVGKLLVENRFIPDSLVKDLELAFRRNPPLYHHFQAVSSRLENYEYDKAKEELQLLVQRVNLHDEA